MNDPTGICGTEPAPFDLPAHGKPAAGNVAVRLFARAP